MRIYGDQNRIKFRQQFKANNRASREYFRPGTAE